MNLVILAAISVPLALVGGIWYVIGRAAMHSQLFRGCLAATLLLVAGACGYGFTETLAQFGWAMIFLRLAYGIVGVLALCGAIYSLWKHEEI